MRIDTYLGHKFVTKVNYETCYIEEISKLFDQTPIERINREGIIFLTGNYKGNKVRIKLGKDGGIVLNTLSRSLIERLTIQFKKDLETIIKT